MLFLKKQEEQGETTLKKNILFKEQITFECGVKHNVICVVKFIMIYNVQQAIACLDVFVFGEKFFILFPGILWSSIGGYCEREILFAYYHLAREGGDYMEQSSSSFEERIRHQFDRLCCLALKGEAANYHKHMAYRQKHEVMLSELSEEELSKIFTMDEYEFDNECFNVMNCDVEVKDALIADALKELSEKKRNIILMAYFMDMSDSDIARELNLVRSTIYEHRKNSLKFLRKIMENGLYEKKE